MAENFVFSSIKLKKSTFRLEKSAIMPYFLAIFFFFQPNEV